MVFSHNQYQEQYLPSWNDKHYNGNDELVLSQLPGTDHSNSKTQTNKFKEISASHDDLEHNESCLPPVVRVEDHYGRIGQAQDIQFIQHSTNLLIHEGYGRVVRVSQSCSVVVRHRVDDTRDDTATITGIVKAI